jgi:hypothetical protein
MNTFVGDCHYCCDTLGVCVLCFAGHRIVDSYSACDCRNLDSCLAVDRQKAVEINFPLAFSTQ